MGWTRIKKLGEGAAGSVSLAHSSLGTGPILPHQLAVKSAKCSTWEASSLEHEHKIFGKLQHPNVLMCYGIDKSVENGIELCNLLLEFADGGDLFERIHSSGQQLSESEIRAFTRSLLSALACIHKTGIAHCDLKPDNILLVRTFPHGITPKIADFGHAVEEDTFSVVRKGTPCYMAPESIVCGRYGPKVDIWAVGCILIEMLLRKRLTEPSCDMEALALRRIKSKAVELPHGISSEASDFLDKCLKPNPFHRWDAEKLLSHPYLAGRKRAVEVVTPVPSKKRRTEPLLTSCY